MFCKIKNSPKSTSGNIYHLSAYAFKFHRNEIQGKDYVNRTLVIFTIDREFLIGYGHITSE